MGVEILWTWQLLNHWRASATTYTNTAQSQTTNWLGSHGHGFKGQGRKTFYSSYLCLSLCLSLHTKDEKYWYSETWCQCVSRWTLEPADTRDIAWHWLLTLGVIFVFLGWKNSTGLTFMQFSIVISCAVRANPSLREGWYRTDSYSPRTRLNRWSDFSYKVLWRKRHIRLR